MVFTPIATLLYSYNADKILLHGIFSDCDDLIWFQGDLISNIVPQPLSICPGPRTTDRPGFAWTMLIYSGNQTLIRSIGLPTRLSHCSIELPDTICKDCGEGYVDLCRHVCPDPFYRQNKYQRPFTRNKYLVANHQGNRSQQSRANIVFSSEPMNPKSTERHLDNWTHQNTCSNLRSRCQRPI
jgi:hypothetical protein